MLLFYAQVQGTQVKMLALSREIKESYDLYNKKELKNLWDNLNEFTLFLGKLREISWFAESYTQ